MLDTDIAPVAALFADKGRAAMLLALLDGRPLAAGELARVAGVSPATASAHLARLQDGGMVTAIKQGRHRYYTLTGPDVADVLESLARISPPVEVRSLRQSRAARALSEARTCYDHLAGRAGVRLHDALIGRGVFASGYELTSDGVDLLARLGVDAQAVRNRRRRFAGSCLDWTERRPHLNGALGAAIARTLIERRWFERTAVRRALRLTDAGEQGLRDLESS